MKILFVTRSYFPYLIGGLEKFAREYYENIKNKADVDLLAGKSSKRLSLSFILRALIYLVFRSREYEVIHFRDAVLSPFVPVVRLFSKAKIVFTVHGLDIVYPNRVYQFIVPRLLNQADKVCCVSDYTLAQCAARGVDPGKLVRITNGFDFSETGGDKPCVKQALAQKYQLDFSGKKLLLTVGRLAKRKGHAWFIEQVMPNLPEEYLYLIAGDGPELDDIQQAILRNGLAPRVALLGLVSEEDKICLYQSSDWFVMPNIHVPDDQEGFGIVLIEAGGYGLPVVAANIEGIQNAVINAVTGYLVPERDEAAFAEKILNGVFDRENITQAVQEHYSWDRISDEYLLEFSRLI